MADKLRQGTLFEENYYDIKENSNNKQMLFLKKKMNLHENVLV